MLLLERFVVFAIFRMAHLWLVVVLVVMVET